MFLELQRLDKKFLVGTQSEIGQIRGKDLIPRKKLISVLTGGFQI